MRKRTTLELRAHKLSGKANMRDKAKRDTILRILPRGSMPRASELVQFAEYSGLLARALTRLPSLCLSESLCVSTNDVQYKRHPHEIAVLTIKKLHRVADQCIGEPGWGT